MHKFMHNLALTLIHAHICYASPQREKLDKYLQVWKRFRLVHSRSRFYKYHYMRDYRSFNTYRSLVILHKVQSCILSGSRLSRGTSFASA